VRRAAALAAVVVVVAAGLAALLLAFTARDDAEIDAGAAPAGPGALQADRGSGHDRPAAAGELPTSGPHRPDLVMRDRRELTNDQLLHALELGDVVIAYGPAEPPAALVRLQRAVAGPFDAEVAAAGQAVILMRRPGLDAPVALAWRRTQGGGTAALRAFAEAWLGRGA